MPPRLPSKMRFAPRRGDCCTDVSKDNGQAMMSGMTQHPVSIVSTPVTAPMKECAFASTAYPFRSGPRDTHGLVHRSKIPPRGGAYRMDWTLIFLSPGKRWFPERRYPSVTRPWRPQTTASELYFLKHQRSCACCSRGNGSSQHVSQLATQSLFDALGWSQNAERRFIDVVTLARLHVHRVARSGVQTVRRWQRVQEACPHFLVVLSALAYPQGGHRSQLACLLVLAAMLAEMHVKQPFCSALSCIAAWSVFGEFHLLLRIFAAVCAWIWPAFPLDNGAPVQGERSSAPAGHLACQVGPSGGAPAESPGRRA